jgi:hypothetical protein
VALGVAMVITGVGTADTLTDGVRVGAVGAPVVAVAAQPVSAALAARPIRAG